MLYDNTKATPKQQEAPSGASSGALNPKRVIIKDGRYNGVRFYRFFLNSGTQTRMGDLSIMRPLPATPAG